jgi:hypothetical protein
MEPCPELSSAIKQVGPVTVKVPMGVATLHGLLTRVTVKTLPDVPVSVAVMIQFPANAVVVWLPLPLLLLLDPQLANKAATTSKLQSRTLLRRKHISILLSIVLINPGEVIGPCSERILTTH